MFAKGPCSPVLLGRPTFRPPLTLPSPPSDGGEGRVRGPTDPRSPDAVAPALLESLRRCLRVHGLRYATPPAPLPDGWETYIYTFQLAGPGLPPAWSRPLLLRVHANGRALARARHE